MEEELLELQAIIESALTDEVETNRQFEVRYSTQNYCPRLHYYAVTDPAPAFISASAEAIFESGHGLHTAMQTRLMKKIVANFEFIGYIDHETGKYVEFSFNSEGCPPGHADGLIRYKGKHYVLEIKTVALDKLDKIRTFGPARPNVVQAQCYAREFEKMGYQITGIMMFYVERSRFEQSKQFFVPYDPRIGEGYVAMVQYGNACIEQGILPEGICRNGVEARYCPRWAQCFNERNPSLFYDPGFRELIDIIYPAEPNKRPKLELLKWTP